MAGITDEAEFDRMAAKLDLMPLMADMTVPWLSVAGEADELSPIACTYELAAACGAPAPLLVYEGERHAFSGAPSTVLGPDWYTWACDWLVDRAAGVEVEERFDFVRSEGVVERRPHPRETAAG